MTFVFHTPRQLSNELENWFLRFPVGDVHHNIITNRNMTAITKLGGMPAIAKFGADCIFALSKRYR